MLLRSSRRLARIVQRSYEGENAGLEDQAQEWMIPDRNMMQVPKTITRIVPVILIVPMYVILASCGEDYDDKEERFIDLIAENRMGDPDYWLERRGDYFTGEWYKVGLIFGFGDGYDSTVCQEIADDQNARERYSTPKYRCVAAN